MKHTQGEWKVASDKYGDEYATNIIGGEHCKLLAQAIYDNRYFDLETAEANAKLIASAPEMLEVLKAIVNHFIPADFLDNGLEERITQAKAAIKKATS